jgi:hypothetical protein
MTFWLLEVGSRNRQLIACCKNSKGLRSSVMIDDTKLVFHAVSIGVVRTRMYMMVTNRSLCDSVIFYADSPLHDAHALDWRCCACSHKTGVRTKITLKKLPSKLSQ